MTAATTKPLTVAATEPSQSSNTKKLVGRESKGFKIVTTEASAKETKTVEKTKSTTVIQRTSKPQMQSQQQPQQQPQDEEESNPFTCIDYACEAIISIFDGSGGKDEKSAKHQVKKQLVVAIDCEESNVPKDEDEVTGSKRKEEEEETEIIDVDSVFKPSKETAIKSSGSEPSMEEQKKQAPKKENKTPKKDKKALKKAAKAAKKEAKALKNKNKKHKKGGRVAPMDDVHVDLRSSQPGQNVEPLAANEATGLKKGDKAAKTIKMKAKFGRLFKKKKSKATSKTDSERNSQPKSISVDRKVTFAPTSTPSSPTPSTAAPSSIASGDLNGLADTSNLNHEAKPQVNEESPSAARDVPLPDSDSDSDCEDSASEGGEDNSKGFDVVKDMNEMWREKENVMKELTEMWQESDQDLVKVISEHISFDEDDEDPTESDQMLASQRTYRGLLNRS